MAFSDILQGDSLNQLFQNPAMLAGLQMLAASGPQQGNPGFGARMGQALGGTATQLQQIQHSQALQQYRQQMMQQQVQQMAMQQEAAQRKADQQQRQQAAFQDPAVLEQMGPLAKMLAQAGLDPTTVLRAQAGDNLQAHRAAQLQQQQSQFDTRQAHQGQSSGPRMPTQRQVLDEPLGEGLMQRHVLNPQTGQYEKYGEPFNQYSPGRKAKAAATGADAAEAAMLGADEADVSSLPGTGGLQSYMPQPQQPVGVMPMTAAGSVPGAAHKLGTRKPGQPKIAEPLTKAEYDALPSGTQYLDPASGRVATKR
ncbi:hypothetical protein [Pseudomonas sp. NBRC 111140]|uniref:hypothetical protein n=1 Tax=Pseudomonas sp. NBRC 111140 TaxID=1661055 RepID=UPI000761C490|nr:hypothetical protein [Pseudomonas sp. NBRC 111140]